MRDQVETNLLLEFVRERDVHCPRCDYNLRNLTQPVCPECREELLLKVGVRKIRLVWLLLTLAPGAFCGIAIAIFGVMCFFLGSPGRLDAEEFLLVVFMIASGLFTLGLSTRHTIFLRQSEAAQIMWAGGVWGVHALAFALFLSQVL